MLAPLITRDLHIHDVVNHRSDYVIYRLPDAVDPDVLAPDGDLNPVLIQVNSPKNATYRLLLAFLRRWGSGRSDCLGHRRTGFGHETDDLAAITASCAGCTATVLGTTSASGAKGKNMGFNVLGCERIEGHQQPQCLDQLARAVLLYSEHTRLQR